jgi:internalin A
LETLIANRLIAVPLELGSGHYSVDNALPRLRAWQQDLAEGEAPNSTVKLYVLGNGRVGKTQICRRLCGEPFDASIPSTHGICLGQLRLVEARGDQPAVDAHFWDFGGQDIYLGTHALFLDERAIYVIAWNPQYESPEHRKDPEPQSGFSRNRPLTYWLEYVHSLAGPRAPVIVEQTQCDRELDVRPAPMPTAEHGFERLRISSSSAKLDDGMERLQLELKSTARYLLERYGKVRLPASWVAVGEELRARSRQKTLSRDTFDALCRTQYGAAVPNVVLDYLHRSGQVFWRKGVFGNQVVLDLA